MPGQQFWLSLLKSCEAVHASLDLKTTQKNIVENAHDLFEAKAAAIMLFDMADGALKISASHGLSQEYLDKGPISPDRSLQETILGSAVVATDVATDSKVQYRKAAASEGILSIVGLPLSLGSIMAGSLRLYYDKPMEFSREELEAMQSFANPSGQARRKSFYFESIKETTEIHRMPALYSFEKTMDRLLKAAAKSAHAKGCALWLINREKSALDLIKSVGLSEKYIAKGSISLEKSLGEVKTQAPVCVTCVLDDERVQYPEHAAEENIESIIGLPVFAGDTVVGALRFYYLFEFIPDEGDYAWMSAMAAHVGSALTKNQLMIKLKADSDDYQDMLEDIHAKHYRTDLALKD
jgi:transcriptional regulator with GAF, ATPase, and Fis domain